MVNVVPESRTPLPRSMSMLREPMDTPLRFIPFLRPMVWGGRRLGDVLGKPLPTPEPYGESWEISDHVLHHSVVADGARAGKTFRQLMEQERDSLLGSAAGRHRVFPWLIKFLDAQDWLSVQVHPNEEAVRKLWPGEGSKTEAWFVLAAEPASKIYAGLLPGVDEPRLRAALAAGKVAECLHHFQPRAGDCLFLPAGTVHAVGGGVLMAEVQQTSDATFRLFDWNRRNAQGKSRTLHIDQALACIDWQRGPVEPIRARGFDTAAHSGQAPRRIGQTLVNCEYFHLEYVRAADSLSLGSGRLQVIIVLQGRCRLVSSSGETVVERGHSWLLPAAMPAIQCRPDSELGLLLCTLP
jgi:mannose-6-phosphate isomerase